MVRTMRYPYVAVVTLAACVSLAEADPVRLDGLATFGHFQQQAKPDVGVPRGERLGEYTALTLSAAGFYDLHRYLAVGAFGSLDLGTRRAGELMGFDAEERATIEPAVGGRYTEVWAGVAIRGQWRALSADLGYGAT